MGRGRGEEISQGKWYILNVVILDKLEKCGLMVGHGKRGTIHSLAFSFLISSLKWSLPGERLGFRYPLKFKLTLISIAAF